MAVGTGVKRRSGPMVVKEACQQPEDRDRYDYGDSRRDEFGPMPIRAPSGHFLEPSRYGHDSPVIDESRRIDLERSIKTLPVALNLP